MDSKLNTSHHCTFAAKTAARVSWAVKQNIYQQIEGSDSSPLLSIGKATAVPCPALGPPVQQRCRHTGESNNGPHSQQKHGSISLQYAERRRQLHLQGVLGMILCSTYISERKVQRGWSQALLSGDQ